MADHRSLVRESPLAAPLCVLLIIAAALAAYHNSFSGPFVFDDIAAIVENPSIAHLWPITQVMAPPLSSAGANGRPIVNLSLAVNYALGGTNVTGYHIVNLLLHVAVALVLFSLLLRTLRLPSLTGRFKGEAWHIALAITLLWTVHPLLTESVTSVIQRNELIVGLFYLATIYGVVRSFDSTRKTFWYACAIATCLLGMASKEVMATAPVMVWLYDRAFLSGSFKKSLGQRWPLYLGLSATWVLLGFLVFSHNDRNGTVGFGLGVAWWAYVLTQCQAIVRYLGLAVWPQTLVFDYGMDLVKHVTAVWPQALLLLALLGATAYATLYRPKLGFAGCWFFGILAPSSSVLPLASQTMAEHRMYLPLIAVIAIAVVGLFAKASKSAGLAVVVIAAALLCGGTVRRNEVYRSAVSLWIDTTSKRPGNARAHNELGNALDAAGRTSEALASYDKALQLKPDFAAAGYNKAQAMLKMGQASSAVEWFDRVLRNDPAHFEALKGKADALVQAGRSSAAIPTYEVALRLQPGDLGAARGLGIAYYRMGNASAQAGELEQAVAAYEGGLKYRPEYPEAHNNLGTVLRRLGRLEEARRHYGLALQYRPDYPEARRNLAALVGPQDVPSIEE
jgi:protein O-mannosyl-transferase